MATNDSTHELRDVLVHRRGDQTASVLKGMRTDKILPPEQRESGVSCRDALIFYTPH